MFAARTFIEAALVSLGINERQRQQATFNGDEGYELFDAAGRPLFPITKAKAYAKPRDVRIVDLCVVHVTAVRGGFGVSKSRLKYWRARLDKGDLPTVLTMQLPEESTADEDAHRLALWERLVNVPYHGFASRNGDALALHPLSRHSWHGNGGNVGIGFAVDCAPDEKLDDWMVETGRAAFSITLARLLRESNAPVIRVAPHRAFSSQRRNDTGPYVWKEIIEPVVMNTARVRIDYEVKKDGGLPVPKTWDDDALYDAKGNKAS